MNPIVKAIIAVIVMGFLIWLAKFAPIDEPYKTIARGLCVLLVIIYVIIQLAQYIPA